MLWRMLTVLIIMIILLITMVDLSWTWWSRYDNIIYDIWWLRTDLSTMENLLDPCRCWGSNSWRWKSTFDLEIPFPNQPWYSPQLWRLLHLPYTIPAELCDVNVNVVLCATMCLHDLLQKVFGPGFPENSCEKLMKSGESKGLWGIMRDWNLSKNP